MQEELTANNITQEVFTALQCSNQFRTLTAQVVYPILMQFEVTPDDKYLAGEVKPIKVFAPIVRDTVFKLSREVRSKKVRSYNDLVLNKVKTKAVKDFAVKTVNNVSIKVTKHRRKSKEAKSRTSLLIDILIQRREDAFRRFIPRL
jgi:hypothetical protein